MSEVTAIALGMRRIDWLTKQQASISENIANVNTPGYRAREASPFPKYLANGPRALAVTNAAHFGDVSSTPVKTRGRGADSWDASYSGNTVNLDQEMVNSAKVRVDYAATTSIIKALARMQQLALKA